MNSELPYAVPTPASPTGAGALAGTASAHPLAAVIEAAARGSWPAADGGWTVFPSWRPGLGAVVAFTGHSFICTDRPPAHTVLAALGCDGFGGATLPAVLTRLARGGQVDCLDVLLAARGRALADPPLRPRPDLADHPRAVHARWSRDEVTTYGYADSARTDVATVGRGPAGLLSIGVEAQTPGFGSTLFRDLLDTLPAQLVLAGVAPGNARSLRSALAAGMVPIGSIQLFAIGSGR